MIVISADISLAGAGFVESDLVLSLTDIEASRNKAARSFIRDEIEALWSRAN
ncbi:hypothetical protein D3C75_931890 [compost metagenome]